MAKRVEVRFLEESDLGQMYQTFSEAFSQYSVNMSMSKAAFLDRMTKKLSLRFDQSPGFFIGDKLVGFIFHAVAEYESELAAYNGGTGVIPGYWGRDITKNMYDYWLRHVRNTEIRKSVLEVITDNHKALKAYRKAGFEVAKRYKCFKLKELNASKSNDPALKVLAVNPSSLDGYKPLQEFSPSMLDSNALLSHNLKNETVLEARQGDTLAGYIIFQQKVGRISQLGVAKDKRHLGIGTRLVRAALEASDQEHLTLINVAENQSGMIGFLESTGFQNQIDQFEMQLKL